MTLLALLRLLDARQIGLALAGDGIDAEGPPGSLTPDVADAIRPHKGSLLRLLTPSAIREHFHIPCSHAPIGKVLAVVMIRLAAERKAFTPAERTAYATRVIDREAAEPRYMAELFAIEDVVGSRQMVLDAPLQTATAAAA